MTRKTEEISDNAYRGCALTIMALRVAPWLCMALVLIGAIVAARAAPDHWMCDYTNALTVYPNVRLAEFDEEAYMWRDMPSDLGKEGFLFLPLTEEVRSGYHMEFSPSKQEIWLWPFWSLDSRPDDNGDYEGNHDFCPVLIVTLEKPDNGRR